MAPAQNTISAVSASKYTQSWVYFTILFGYAFINGTIHCRTASRPAASGQGEASLQMFLHRRGFPLPLSKHILSNSRKMVALLEES